MNEMVELKELLNRIVENVEAERKDREGSVNMDDVIKHIRPLFNSMSDTIDFIDIILNAENISYKEIFGPNEVSYGKIYEDEEAIFGKSVYGRFIVVEEGKIAVISFRNNFADKNGFVSDLRWWKSLNKNQAIVAMELSVSEYEEDTTTHSACLTLYKKPYFMEDFHAEEAKKKVNIVNGIIQKWLS